MKITVYFLIILFTCQSYALAPLPVKNNFEVLESLAHKSSEELVSQIKSHSCDTLAVTFEKYPGLWLVEQYLYSDKGLTFFSADSMLTNTARLVVRCKYLGVRYSILNEGPDSLLREAEIRLSYSLTDKSGKIIQFPDINQFYEDHISRESILQIERPGHDFTKSEVPEAPESFFHELAEPIIAVGSAIITVVLFFTVRSE